MFRVVENVLTGERVEVPLTPDEIDALSAVTHNPVPIIDAIDLWQRTTNEESEAIEAYMGQAPARERNIFRTAATFRGDHELFSLLEAAANSLFSPERVSVLLEPSRFE